MGTILIVAFPNIMKILNFLKPKPAQPTIDSYGQASSGVEPIQMRSLMEWLFASLLNAGYLGKSHQVLYDSDRLVSSLRDALTRTLDLGDACGGKLRTT
jgi:hypothetical protein